MAIKIFLQLPDDEDTIFELGEKQDNYVALINELIDCVSFIIESKQDIHLIYDNLNINKFKALAGDLIDADEYLTTPIKRLKIKMRRLAGYDWRQKPQQQSNANYFLWDYRGHQITNENQHTLAEITEQILSTPEDEYLLYSLRQQYTNREFIPIFKDSWIESNVPKFAHINFVLAFDKFELWWKSIAFDFSLLNKNRFIRTSEKHKGARVYKEERTNRFWYIDTLHKDHYEVFDRNRQHIGIADLNGELDTSKKEDDRTF